MRRSRLSGPRLALGAVLLALPTAAAGQQGCQFIEGSGNLQTIDYGAGAVTYVGTPNLSCRDGVRIRADSAVAFQASNYVQLIGHVRFDDPERRLTAQNAEYFTTVGRLQAHNGAELVQKTDSTTVRGQEMIYNRADRTRPRAQLEVFGDRPHARLHVRAAPDTAAGDSARAARPDSARIPYDIVADRIVLEADSSFKARGGVEIVRQDLRAFADSVEYFQGGGDLRLMSQARMKIEDRDLSADLITALLPGDEVREVVAQRHALLASEDFTLRSPVVHVFFEQGAMQRLVAVPVRPAAAAPPAGSGSAAPAPGAGAPTPGGGGAPPLSEDDRARPVATSEDFRIVADSLDVRAPGEVLDRIHAVGGSRAESSARDSVNTPDTPAIARTDWMEGDTIVAQFVPTARDSTAGAALAAAPPAPGATAAAPDSARPRYRIDRLSATGQARTLYRMEPNDSARARGEKRPAIHYVTASSIVLQWADGEVQSMEVKGQTEGVHAEPARAHPDSGGARPDSAGIGRDSARAPAGAPGAPGFEAALAPSRDGGSSRGGAPPQALAAGKAARTAGRRRRRA